MFFFTVWEKKKKKTLNPLKRTLESRLEKLPFDINV